MNLVGVKETTLRDVLMMTLYRHGRSWPKDSDLLYPAIVDEALRELKRPLPNNQALLVRHLDAALRNALQRVIGVRV